MRVLLLLALVCSAGSAAAQSPFGFLVEDELSTARLAGDEDFLAMIDGNPGVISTFEAFVYCALDAEQSVTVNTLQGPVVLQGWMGFAPEWNTGPCDEACQQYVTACVGAKFNAWAVPVEFWLASMFEGHERALEPEYSVVEGAVYGNVFGDDFRAMYACRGPFEDPLLRVYRRCFWDPAACGVQDAGECLDLDGDGRAACEGFDEAEGTYLRCHARESDDGWPASDRAYRPITVRLRPTGFCFTK